MIQRFLADENFHGAIVRGLLRRIDGITIIRVQDTEIAGSDDPTVLAFAADRNLVTLSHDVRTMAAFAHERVISHKSMPGLIEVRRNASIGQVLEDIHLVCQICEPDDMDGKVLYIPL